MGHCELSFIIPAYDEEELIGATIDAMHDVMRSFSLPYEIIVADDESTDRTAEIARAHGAIVVATSNRQIAATRNAGARVARGEMFIFVDADTFVSEGAVRGAIDAMRNGAVGGGCAAAFTGEVPRYARVLLPVCVLLLRFARCASGCFLFCTREAFHATGGFDRSQYAGEEIFMSRALKRQGKFRVLRETVATSGRKLRSHSPTDLAMVLVKAAFTGGRTLRRRDGLELWYGPRERDSP